MSLAEGLALEREAFVEVFRTDDSQIGVKSFLEHGPGQGRRSPGVDGRRATSAYTSIVRPAIASQLYVAWSSSFARRRIARALGR